MARKKLAKVNHPEKQVVKKTKKKIPSPVLKTTARNIPSQSHLENSQQENTGWLKISEPSFEFWNNPEDSEYDKV